MLNVRWHAIMPILILGWTLEPEKVPTPPPFSSTTLPFVQICLRSGDRTRQELELVSAMLTFCLVQKMEGMHAAAFFRRTFLPGPLI